MVGDVMSGLPKSRWSSRSLQRIAHVAIAVVVGTGVYSLLGSTAGGDAFPELTVFPALVVSGLPAWHGHRLRPFLSGLPRDAHPGPQRLVGLTVITVLSGVGHRIDRFTRGNHVGWPSTPETDAFAFGLLPSLLIPPGLYFGRRNRAGVPYWTRPFLASSLPTGVAHSGPSAIEPPADPITVYENTRVGRFGPARVVGFSIVLAAGLRHAVALPVRQSNQSLTGGFRDE